MAVDQKTIGQDASNESPAETLREIVALLQRLHDIYKSDLPELLPNELLQLSHTYTLFSKISQEHSHNPAKLLEIQLECCNELSNMFSDFNIRIVTLREHKSIFKAFEGDNRFTNSVWFENPYFELLRRSYHLIRKYALRTLYSLDGLDNKTRQQAHFYIVNLLNYVSPTNYAWTNPEVIRATIESGGTNLLRGVKNYLEDLVLNKGRLNVRMTDTKAFKVGKNLAVTPGKVIFQNRLMQLIQYAPTTEQVYKTPILFTPPWINKFYVLDLSQNNSMVKWLVDQGYTVFMISWVNATAELADAEFEDYMLEGPIQALDVITKTTKADNVHMVGYCIGGTLLACTLAYMQAKNDTRAKSSTFLMSLLNFSNPGELGVFLDEPQIDALEKVMRKNGYLNGRLLEMTFNTLRPNELIWPYFIHNYLLGKPSRPFDLLYWNSDSSNLPYKMYNYYLRNMYLENNLRKPGGITLDAVPIDLGKITTPCLFIASETDHITLWKSIYSGLNLLGGPVDFVLSESGHVRGVINPPTKTKYNFKINTKYKAGKAYPKKTSEWLEGATMQTGSWWPYWVEWLIGHDDGKVPARQIDKALIVEDAPGSYVKKRL